MSYNFDPNNQNNPYGGAALPPHYLVTQSAKNIKSMTRQALKGHWGEAILAAFIIEAIMSGPRIFFGMMNSGFLAFLSDFYGIVITGPANVGLVMFLMGIFRMENPEKRLIYKGFQDKELFIKGLLVYCSMMIRIIFLSFLFIIPGVIAAFKYSMAYRVLVDHPEYTAGDCLRASANIMSGNKLKLFMVELSFWFWLILVNIPRSVCTQQAIAAVADIEGLLTDMEVFNRFINDVNSNPWIILTYVLTVILNVYIQTSMCCFYDLAAGNLVVRQSYTGDNENGNQ